MSAPTGHARYWRQNRHRMKQCPPGVPEDIWFDVLARYRAYGSLAVELLEQRGPMTSQQIADALCPGLNAGRMGEVMKILRRYGRVEKDERRWSVAT